MPIPPPSDYIQDHIRSPWSVSAPACSAPQITRPVEFHETSSAVTYRSVPATFESFRSTLHLLFGHSETPLSPEMVRNLSELSAQYRRPARVISKGSEPTFGPPRDP